MPDRFTDREGVTKGTHNPDGEMKMRRLLVDTADYWFRGSRDESYSLAERLLFLENALNHTENALIGILDDPAGEFATKFRAALIEQRSSTSPRCGDHRSLYPNINGAL